MEGKSGRLPVPFWSANQIADGPLYRPWAKIPPTLCPKMMDFNDCDAKKSDNNELDKTTTLNHRL